jgi:type II secretory pathway pseudopilin PulG
MGTKDLIRTSPGRWQTRGLTLVEMLVTVTLFLAISAAMAAMLHQSQRASEKTVSTSDANSMAVLLYEKLRLELRRTRVVDNPNPETLNYWIYEKENGLPKFGAPGELLFLSLSGDDPDVAELTLEDSNLVRHFQSEKTILANVGPEGEVRFDWLIGIQALVVDGQVGERNESRESLGSVKKFHFTLALSNVE